MDLFTKIMNTMNNKLTMAIYNEILGKSAGHLRYLLRMGIPISTIYDYYNIGIGVKDI